jgi:peptidoglycan/LPS O-acetylase OafA/YrhL
MKYSAPLDGIRALSILAVIVNHASPGWLTGGYAGVDVFFVLSGYLITHILGEGLEGGRFSFREFYLRRIQRLVPNLITMLLAVMAAAIFILPKAAAQTHGNHALWVVLNGSNFFIWQHFGSYWGLAAETAPLTHTWSLAVEEQFYLLYPLLFVFLSRRQPRAVIPVLAGVFLLSLGLCLYLTRVSRPAAFYLLPGRGWELIAGALLALVIRKYGPLRWRHLAAAGWVGMAMLAVSFIQLHERSRFPGHAAILPVLGSVLLILSVETATSAVSRMLSTKAAVAVGKASYSLYLWHWPFIVFAKILAVQHEWPLETAAWIGVAGGVVAGLLAYRLVEAPLRVRGPGRSRRLALTAAGTMAALAASSWLSLRELKADGFGRFDPVIDRSRVYDTRVGSQEYWKAPPPASMYDVVLPREGDWPADRWREGGIIRQHGKEGPPRVVVLGSSHALMYCRVIEELCRERQLPVAFITASGGNAAFFAPPDDRSFRGPFPSPKIAQEFDETRQRFLRQWKPELVFLIDRWDLMLSPQAVEARMREFIGTVGKEIGTVTFVAQVPAHKGGNDVNLREVVSTRINGPTDPLPRLFPDAKDSLRKDIVSRIEALRETLPQLRIIRPDLQFYQSDGSILYAEGRTFLYMDDDHLCDAGAERVRSIFANLLAEVARPPAAAAPPP